MRWERKIKYTNTFVDVAYFREKADLQQDWPTHADAKTMHQTRQQGDLGEAATSRISQGSRGQIVLGDGSNAVVGRVKVASSNPAICACY